MSVILTVNNADNQVVAYLNDIQVYNKSTEGNPTFSDTVDLTAKLQNGSNSLLIVGVNWGGPATFKGGVNVNGTSTPWSYQVSSSANGLIWNQLFNIPWTNNPATITFSGLVIGGSANSYTESGYNLSGTNIYAGSVPSSSSKCAFPSMSTSVFTFKRADGNPFTLKSLKLSNINSTLPPQGLVFTGHLANGGTVTNNVTIPTGYNFLPYAFPASFANLASITWTPNTTGVTDIAVQ